MITVTGTKLVAEFVTTTVAPVRILVMKTGVKLVLVWITVLVRKITLVVTMKMLESKAVGGLCGVGGVVALEQLDKRPANVMRPKTEITARVSLMGRGILFILGLLQIRN
jgi:hypothetical protein